MISNIEFKLTRLQFKQSFLTSIAICSKQIKTEFKTYFFLIQGAKYNPLFLLILLNHRRVNLSEVSARGYTCTDTGACPHHWPVSTLSCHYTRVLHGGHQCWRVGVRDYGRLSNHKTTRSILLETESCRNVSNVLTPALHLISQTQ